jgi:hypothetical protein
MTLQINQGAGQTQGASAVSPASAGAGVGGGVDFKNILTELYKKPQTILQDYANPNTTEMDIPGFGTLDKQNNATSLALGVTISRFDAQLTTLLNQMEFILKTLPQKADSLWS